MRYAPPRLDACGGAYFYEQNGEREKTTRRNSRSVLYLNGE